VVLAGNEQGIAMVLPHQRMDCCTIGLRTRSSCLVGLRRSNEFTNSIPSVVTSKAAIEGIQEHFGLEWLLEDRQGLPGELLEIGRVPVAPLAHWMVRCQNHR